MSDEAVCRTAPATPGLLKMTIIVGGCLIAQMKRFDALITTQKTPALCEVPFWKKSKKIIQNDTLKKNTIF